MRATNIVKEAWLDGQTLPDIHAISQLSAQSKKPQLAELNDILSFHHLILCIECAFRSQEMWRDAFPDDNDGPSDSRYPIPDLPMEPGVWKDIFHRALYRMLLSGAVLTKAYNEPFTSALENAPIDFMEKYFQRYQNNRESIYAGRARVWPLLSQSDVDYLNKFTVFNQEACIEHEETVFGSLAEWLVQGRQSEGHKSPGPPTPWEITLLLNTFMLMQDDMFANMDGSIGYGRSLAGYNVGAQIVPKAFKAERKTMILMLGAFEL